MLIASGFRVIIFGDIHSDRIDIVDIFVYNDGGIKKA
jgi:hypothetical protein